MAEERVFRRFAISWGKNWCEERDTRSYAITRTDKHRPIRNSEGCSIAVDARKIERSASDLQDLVEDMR